ARDRPGAAAGDRGRGPAALRRYARGKHRGDRRGGGHQDREEVRDDAPRGARLRGSGTHSFLKLSWQDLQAWPTGPKAALIWARSPVFAAAFSLTISSCILVCAARNLSASLQISGLALVSPLSVPSTNPANGSFDIIVAISALSAAAF